eukprot:9500126-Pyramimonas_sp.AAC.1
MEDHCFRAIWFISFLSDDRVFLFTFFVVSFVSSTLLVWLGPLSFFDMLRPRSEVDSLRPGRTTTQIRLSSHVFLCISATGP